jgi:predicted alpha/beta-hydrolase family hydrolase
LALSFPLHPPGRSERSRVEELTGSGVPTLVAQGERDPMGRPEEFPAGTDLYVVPGGDHSLKVPKRGVLSQGQAMADLCERVERWLSTLARKSRE